MTQEEKLEKVAMWLAKNHIRYHIHIKGADDKLAHFMRLVTCEKSVVLCVCPPDSEDDVYNDVRKLRMHPVFIRDKENIFFIIEKVRSALKGWNAKFAKEQEEKAKAAAKTGHKRTRFSIIVGNVKPNNLNVYGNEG